MRDNSDQLAILGGDAVAARLQPPIWPPRSKDTAKRLLEVYESGDWGFSLSPHIDDFARDFAHAHGATHGVFMANGTVTLMCALGALGVGPGDEVIVPAYTWLATATAVRHVGAKIVFCDVERDTLCLDPQSYQKAISRRTKAVIPVHFMGSLADMDSIIGLSTDNGIAVIEDCAQAHGSRWNGKPVGSLGNIGSFSFQQNKIMSSGEGGICTTSDPVLADRMHRMAYIGYAPGESFGNFKSPPPSDMPCYNFRGTQLQAVLLQEQLLALPDRVGRYSHNAALLRERLEQVPGVRLQTPGRLAEPQSYYKLAFVFDEDPLREIPIDLLMRTIQAEGLPVQPSYGTVPDHILFQLPSQDYLIPPDGIEVSKTVGADRVIMLSHQWLDRAENEMAVIAAAFEKVAANIDSLSRAKVA